jgi:phage protein U
MSASIVLGSAQRTLARCTPMVTQARHMGMHTITKVSKDQSLLRSSGTQRMASRRVSVTAMASGSDAGLKIDLRGM